MLRCRNGLCEVNFKFTYMATKFNFKEWFDINKVPIFGALSAGVMIFQQAVASARSANEKLNWIVIGYAVGVGIISFIARNWRGQSASLTGIIVNTAIAFMTVYETGHFTLEQFLAQLGAVLAMAFLPDPKSRGYEQTDTIRDAKIEGEKKIPAALTNSEVKAEAKAEIKAGV